MAYLDRTDPRSRATAVIGVGAVHALIAAALVAGLAVTGMSERKVHVAGFDVAPTPTPTPPPAPQDQARARPTMVAPLPPLDVPHAQPTAAPYDPTEHLLPLDPLPHETAPVTPQPTPQPSFAPKGASPLGNASRWITNDDYPAGPLRRGDEGLARYRLVIASTGKVTACEITGSSGSADLDRETCRLLSKRAQFAPATDSSGAKVVGTFGGSVRWDIPD